MVKKTKICKKEHFDVQDVDTSPGAISNIAPNAAMILRKDVKNVELLGVISISMLIVPNAE